MKRVEDIQKDLEEVVQKVKIISSDIINLEKGKTEESELVDFNAVEIAAKAKLFNNHYLSDEDEAVQRKYLTLLFSALFGNNCNIEGALSYLYKIGYSIDYEGDLKKLYIDGINLTSDEMLDILKTIEENEYALVFMVDLLLLVEKYLPDKQLGRQYASKMFFLLHFSEKGIDCIISFVKTILTGNYNYYIGITEYLPDELWAYIQDNPELLHNIRNQRKAVYADIEPQYAQYYYSDTFSQKHICDNDQAESLYYMVDSISINYDSDASPDKLSLAIKATNSPNGDTYFLNCHNFSPLLKEAIVDLECQNKSYELFCTIDIFCNENEAFENAEYVEPSWNPKIGYYHLKIDSFDDSWDWFYSQPDSNPNYSSLNVIELRKKALEEDWSSYYTVNMTVTDD